MDISSTKYNVNKYNDNKNHDCDGSYFLLVTIAGPADERITSAKSFCRWRKCVMSDALHIR